MDARPEVSAASWNPEPYALAKHARDYLDAAHTLRLKKENENKEEQYFSPVPYHLYCLGIELALKALYINKNPGDLPKLKSPDFGHNLIKNLEAAEKALEKNLANTKEREILSQLGNYYGHDGKKVLKAFEYFSGLNIKVSMMKAYTDLPSLSELDLYSKKLLQELEQIKFNINIG